MTIKVEVLGGDAHPGIVEALRKAFGGDDSEARAKMKAEQAMLKAAGWTSDDLCMLNGAIALTSSYGQATMDNLMHAAIAHGSLTAGRAAVGLAEWCAHCCGQIDHAARIMGDEKGDTSGRQEAWAMKLAAAREELAKLEAQAELRRSVAATH